MAYSRRNVADGNTVMNADLYNNLQDGIDESHKSINIINQDIINIEQNISNIDEDITNINQDITNINEDITNINNTVKLYNNVAVNISSFIEDVTYADAGYIYKADIQCTGITSNYIPYITFSMSDAISGNYAPICITGNNIITIYAKEIPKNNIIIPTIKCICGY